MAKQQVLLARVLNNKYTKQFGFNWKKEFKAVKQQWSNPSSVSDLTSLSGNGDGPDTATDSDTANDEDSSGSVAEEETEPKSFLDSILTAARPWSINCRWESIVQETHTDLER